MWFLTAALAADVEFSAGTYGRVQASTDLRGGGGDSVDVARHPPRLGLGPYMELDLAWDIRRDEGPDFSVLITPALSGDLFHYDGVFAEALSLRNFYGAARFDGDTRMEVWAGSRMYRGDDVYLLDFWPLDNLNTFGGGAIATRGPSEIAAHVGVNRLVGDDWQLQRIRVAVPDVVDGREVLFLDRQRTVASLRLVRHVEAGGVTLRGKLYGEAHALPAGARVVDDAFSNVTTEDLPSDRGFLVGGQLSAWGWADQSFVHLWARYSTGLAAYGELTIPSDGLALDWRTAPARSLMLAAMVNHEAGPFGVMAGTYLSNRIDADGQRVDFDDRWEWVVSARPQVYVGEYGAVGVELSHQYVRPNGLNPYTQAFDKAHVTKVSLLPAIQRARGGYSRPRIQAVYTASFLSEGARAYFDPRDARVAPGVQHYVGLGAEWWLNTRRVIAPVRVDGRRDEDEGSR
jgi:hypothetical protein